MITVVIDFVKYKNKLQYVQFTLMNVKGLKFNEGLFAD